MEDEKNVLEKWLEYREEELECGLSKEDKKHIIAFDKFKTICYYLITK